MPLLSDLLFNDKNSIFFLFCKSLNINEPFPFSARAFADKRYPQFEAAAAA